MILLGDAATVLHDEVPDGCVQCCVTSPPYWGLRDYGVEGQLGLESTPDAYVVAMVAVFREVWRVLRDDGTLWLNLGDSYAANRTYQVASTKGGKKHSPAQGMLGGSEVPDGLKPKDLIGIPWRVAFALQADGWYLRSDIIWHKPNPMPESVTDRPTKSHEYLFLFAKSPKYYYDAEAIKEPYAESTLKEARDGYKGQATKDYKAAGAQNPSDSKRRMIESVRAGGGRNRRTVWTITTKPFRGAHFATFPPDLVEPCILAGSRPDDIVLDPFTGAGTTWLVAKRLGREFVGVELNPEYAAMAEDRVEKAR